MESAGLYSNLLLSLLVGKNNCMLCNVTCVFTPPYLQSEFQTSSGLSVKHITGLFFYGGGGGFPGASNFGKNNVKTGGKEV